MAIPVDVEMVGLGFYYEEMPQGRRFRTIGRTITDADITAFVGVTGMTEVLFTNLVYARSESVMKGRVAPAALVVAFAEGLVMQTTLQHTGLAFLGMSLEVKRPVMAGDTITVVCEVSAARLTSNRARGIVTTRNDIYNQDDELVVTYTPTRMIKCRSGAIPD
ncbi:MAG: MaoC family dehydratase [Dehalococcoidia bacterium]